MKTNKVKKTATPVKAEESKPITILTVGDILNPEQLEGFNEQEELNATFGTTPTTIDTPTEVEDPAQVPGPQLANANSQKVKDSQVYVSESGISFRHPQEFIDLFNASVPDGVDTITEFSKPKELENKDSGERIISYGRITHHVRCEMPNDEGSSFTFGFLYCLDTPKPSITLFAGENVKACTNTHIFSADSVLNHDLIKGKGDITKMITEFIAKRWEDKATILMQIQTLKDSFINPFNSSGKILENVLRLNEKIGTTYIIQGMQLLTDPKSKYYVKEGENCSKYHFLNSITENFKKDGSDSLFPQKSQSLVEMLLQVE